MAAFGGLRHVQFQPDGEIAVPTRCRCPPSGSRSCKSHLMLFYTGIARTASDVAEELCRRHRSAAAGSCGIMTELVEESIDILVSGAGPACVRRTAARGLAGEAQPERAGFQLRRSTRCTSGRGRPARSAAS